MSGIKEILAIQKDRTISDSELLQGGADYVEKGGNLLLRVTDAQIAATQTEMQVDFCACEIRGLIERFSAEIVKQAVYQEIPSCKPVSDDIPLWEPKTGREETFVEQAKRVLREKN